MNKASVLFIIVVILALTVTGVHVASVDAQDQAQTPFMGEAGNLFLETSAQLCDTVSSTDSGISECFGEE